MANKLDTIEVVTNFKHLQIREIKDDGGFHRKVLKCEDDVSGESEQVQEMASELWTDEVKDAWATFKVEQEQTK